ncbi:hypothetical protein [Sphingomonas xinjiangensis]|uniref:Uncharacterized protein n=1 Tax=Sphingomonas xinjiangensis TaxID=643568 RepID=A0A840YPE4_9SPHN|nr:hypothetical protein [Sphingomonas xinjiangensis]MBB5709682.1 hypothetical protein [Sphingomonas xinjiangensis]
MLMMLALNQPVESITSRFGQLSYRLIEDEIERAVARNDNDTAEAWRAKLLEVNSTLLR